MYVELDIAKPQLAPYKISETVIDNETFFVVLDKNGKICKSINHEAPDLKSLVDRWVNSGYANNLTE